MTGLDKGLEDAMAILKRADSIKLRPHPRFDGVQMAKLAGKADGIRLGVSLLVISPGVQIPIHTHAESVDSIYCLSGSCEIYLSGRWRSFGKGDYCLVSPMEEHGVRCGQEGETRLFVVHSPPLF